MSIRRSSETITELSGNSVKQDTALLIQAVLANRSELFASEIQQLCFCGDLYATEIYGRRLSGVTYEANMYGPYSEVIESVLNMLVESGEVLTKPALRAGRRNERYVLADKGDIESDSPVTKLSDARLELVSHICEVAPSEMDRLEDVVVESQPYRNASGGDSVRFETGAEGLPPELSTGIRLNINEDELLSLQ